MDIFIDGMKKSTMRKIINILEKEHPGFSKHYREPPFHALIGTVLSQRTRDEVTDKVSEDLFRVAKTPKAMAKLKLSRIKKMVKPINFYKTKARRIHEISRIIAEKYSGKVPKSREELMKLPGVGPKTADCVLSFAYGKPSIPVDTHVEVVSKRLGIAGEKDDYHKIQKKLHEIVPEGKKDILNFLFVEHGKKVCTSFMPKHQKCAIRKYCRYYKKIKSEKNGNRRKKSS